MRRHPFQVLEVARRRIDEEKQSESRTSDGRLHGRQMSVYMISSPLRF